MTGVSCRTTTPLGEGGEAPLVYQAALCNRNRNRNRGSRNFLTSGTGTVTVTC